VLDPDDGHLCVSRLVHETADVRDDGFAVVGPGDDAFLHVDDEECGVRPVLELAHCRPLGSRLIPDLGR
jgi:hypothetical protein